MPKNIEDIILPDKNDRRTTERRQAERRGGRSVRDIPLPENRRRTSSARSAHREEPAKHQFEVIAAERALEEKPRARRRHSRPGKAVWIASAIGILVLGFALLSFFSGATLAYTPKTTPISFNADRYAAAKTGDGSLLFSVVKLSGDKGMEVDATGESEVSVRASGQIVVYNTQNSAQTLIEETRFETPDGKIYKLPAGGGIVVPANGSVEATVYAESPGESYNIGLSDFTVPGLAGTSRFDNVYARSKTAMTGGFVGTRRTVSDEDRASATASLEESLRTELIEQARAQVPQDFILFPSLSTVVFEELPQTEARGDNVTLNRRGNFYGVMFKRNDLAAHMAANKANIAEGEVVEIPELEMLDVTFAGVAPADLLTATAINFQVTGTANLVWRTSEDALKRDLAGRHKRDVPGILNNYPSITSAEAVIRPFWKTSFPEEVTDITVKRVPIN